MRFPHVLLTLLTLASGCAEMDPYTRTGMWRPNGANEKNLHAMIADPNDLVIGAADSSADGQVLSAAVARYRSGRVKALSDGSASQISPITINTGNAAATSSDSD